MAARRVTSDSAAVSALNCAESRAVARRLPHVTPDSFDEQLTRDSQETPLRRFALNAAWIVLPCVGVAAVSEALGWHTAAFLFGFAGLSALGGFTGQAVRATFTKPRS